MGSLTDIPQFAVVSVREKPTDGSVNRTPNDQDRRDIKGDEKRIQDIDLLSFKLSALPIKYSGDGHEDSERNDLKDQAGNENSAS